MSTIKVDSIKSSDGNTDLLTLSNGSVSGVNFGRRNLIINGAMQVAQRGTSGVDTDSYPCADRWRTGGAGTPGAFDVTVENDAPDGFAKSVKFNCTTADSLAAGDYRYFNQRLEGQDLQGIAKGTSSAKNLTVSFWVKSNVTGTYICGIFDTDNSRYVAQSYTVDSSGTWEYKTITFPADTTGAFDNDNNASIRMSWFIAAGSSYTSGTLATSWESSTAANYAVGQTNLASATNNYWQITGVQLEVGSVATPFEHRSFGEELALCQRYYYKTYRYDLAPGSNSADGLCWLSGSTKADNTARLYIRHPVEMRAGPTTTYYIYNTGTVGSWNYERSGATGTVAVSGENMSTSGGRIKFDSIGAAWVAANWYGQYVADAEL
jgi:hypothetical protein